MTTKSGAFDFVKMILPGFVVAAGLALATTFVTQSVSHLTHFFFDPIFIGLLLGLLTRWILGNRFIFWPGFGLTQDLFIPLAILLYGTQVRWNVFSATAAKEFFVPLALAFVVYYLFLVWPSGKLKVRRRGALLIWAACALVGPMAVVLLAPALEASDEEASLSLLLSTGAATLLLILFPIIANLYAFDLFTVGALSTLVLPLANPVNPMTSGSFEAVSAANLFFGAKIAFLGPIALVFYFSRTSAGNREKLPLALIAGFILIGLLFTFITPLLPVAEKVFHLSQLTLTMAMIGVGLSTNLKRLFTERARTVWTYLILAAGASLTAFLLETLAVRLF